MDGRMIQVLSGHFSWWEEERFAYEWNQTEKFLANSPYPLLMMGDFNNDAESLGYNRVLTSHFDVQDAYQIAEEKIGRFTVLNEIDGWKDSQRKLRIDFVFLTREFLVKMYKVVFDDNRLPQVSDHFGIGVQLEWN